MNAHGITDIQTSAQAAEALRPIAGVFTFALFAAGIIGIGLLAVPVLAGSGAYALGEALGWPTGLDRQPLDAKAFYGTIAVSTLVGILINFVGLDPIKALFWSAVINGVVAVPLMVIIMLMAMRRRRDGPLRAAAAAMGDGVAVDDDDGGRGGDHVCDLVTGRGDCEFRQPHPAFTRRAAALTLLAAALLQTASLFEPVWAAGAGPPGTLFGEVELPPLLPPSGDLWTRSTLFDDTAGLRSAMAPYGLALGITETSEILGNFTGGERRGAIYEGVTDLNLGLDLRTYFHWRGVFFARAYQIHGRGLSANDLDNLNTASGLEADRTTRLFELWYEQHIGDWLRVRIGQQSAGQEFLISSSAKLFVQRHLRLAHPAVGRPARGRAGISAGHPGGALSRRRRPGPGLFCRGVQWQPGRARHRRPATARCFGHRFSGQ